MLYFFLAGDFFGWERGKLCDHPVGFEIYVLCFIRDIFLSACLEAQIHTTQKNVSYPTPNKEGL